MSDHVASLPDEQRRTLLDGNLAGDSLVHQRVVLLAIQEQRDYTFMNLQREPRPLLNEARHRELGNDDRVGRGPVVSDVQHDVRFLVAVGFSETHAQLDDGLQRVDDREQVASLIVTIIIWLLRVFAKFKKFQKSKIKLELTTPNQPSPKLLFLNPSLTWTEHSNQNNF